MTNRSHRSQLHAALLAPTGAAGRDALLAQSFWATGVGMGSGSVVRLADVAASRAAAGAAHAASRELRRP